MFHTIKEDSNPSLSVFVGKESWLIFDMLNCDGNWLERNASKWEKNEGFIEMLDLFHDLKLVNNLAEHCVKDMEEFINFSKDEEHRNNILFVATDHREIFQDLRKSSLQK